MQATYHQVDCAPCPGMLGNIPRHRSRLAPSVVTRQRLLPFSVSCPTLHLQRSGRTVGTFSITAHKPSNERKEPGEMVKHLDNDGISRVIGKIPGAVAGKCTSCCLQRISYKHRPKKKGDPRLVCSVNKHTTAIVKQVLFRKVPVRLKSRSRAH